MENSNIKIREDGSLFIQWTDGKSVLIPFELIKKTFLEKVKFREEDIRRLQQGTK